MEAYALFAFSLIALAAASSQVHNAVETEMFSIPISPNLFNWTYQEFDQQYRFQASLLGKPELPSWLRYIYSGRHHSGFIFGTPPRGITQPITLEVVGLNRQDYETRRVLLTIQVQPKSNLARHEVELKIDNLNVEDLLDEHRMNRLKEILKTRLWVESSQDLYTTFLASAIDLGARLPLKPSDGEGVVVRLGSSSLFSSQLKWLREEVRPLSRLPSCPREYKRTTSERLFRDAGFTLDWCNFELYNTIYKEQSTIHVEYQTQAEKQGTRPIGALRLGVWAAPMREALPRRPLSTPLAIAFASPLVLMVLSAIALTAVMCFHHTTIAHKSGNVEVCRYDTGDTNHTQVADNVSKSLGASPNNSLIRPYSPRSTTNLAGNYNRPQPPPYVGINTLHQRRSVNIDKTPSTSSNTPEHRTELGLEESLKLLNDATIAVDLDNHLKDPIIDMADSSEDYVPIKSDGYVAMKNVKEIIVPDLTKFGISGPI